MSAMISLRMGNLLPWRQNGGGIFAFGSFLFLRVFPAIILHFVDIFTKTPPGKYKRE
jgi:hypothetical protein